MNYRFDLFKLKGSVYSESLERRVTFQIVAPPEYLKNDASYPILLMNDGQDYQSLGLDKTLTDAWRGKTEKKFIFVALHTTNQRMHEYGASFKADFKGRGGKAKLYMDFIVEEFVPFLKQSFRLSANPEDWVFSGFSLGGLSAIDIVLNNPHLFGKVGVFSGSFWWRDKAYDPKNKGDRSRIILKTIASLPKQDHLKFWLQCGSHDEEADRNGSGTIDAIEDTKDVIAELTKKGYAMEDSITYVEIEGGRHNQETWGAIFPEFLQWAFRTNKNLNDGKLSQKIQGVKS